jgi:hypothetical protein
MALLTHQPLTEVGLEAAYQAAAVDGDEVVATEDLLLHIKLSAAADESQLISFTGVPTGGTFKLEFDDGTDTNATTDITYAAGLTAATVEAALEALPNIEPADVAVAGSNGGPFTVTFAGQYTGEDIAELAAIDVALTGGTDPAIVITQSSGGVGGVTVSVAAQVPCNFNFFHDRNLAIPAGEERFMGPFPRHYWNEAGRIEISYSSPNGITIAALVPA